VDGLVEIKILKAGVSQLYSYLFEMDRVAGPWQVEVIG